MAMLLNPVVDQRVKAVLDCESHMSGVLSPTAGHCQQLPRHRLPACTNSSIYRRSLSTCAEARVVRMRLVRSERRSMDAVACQACP